MPPTQHRRRRLQFTLRGMLLLMLVVSVVLAILAKGAERQRRAVAAILATGGRVIYDDHAAERATLPAVLDERTSGPKSAPWLRQLIGDDYFRNVVDVTFGGEATDESLSVCRDLPKLQRVTLSVCKNVTDRGLSQLHDHTELKEIHVFFTYGVTETALTAFKTANPGIVVRHMNTW